ncbi:MAG: hypothetical protein ACYCTV_11455 [Leptospirales bacterium]
MSIPFSDGHSTGMYSFELLLDLCPRNACTGRKTS